MGSRYPDSVKEHTLNWNGEVSVEAFPSLFTADFSQEAFCASSSMVGNIFSKMTLGKSLDQLSENIP